MSENTETSIDFAALNAMLGGNVDEPYPVYTFGNGRKVFWSNYQGEGVYDKPVDIVDGTTIHLPDPDNHTNTNP